MEKAKVCRAWSGRYFIIGADKKRHFITMREAKALGAKPATDPIPPKPTKAAKKAAAKKEAAKKAAPCKPAAKGEDCPQCGLGGRSVLNVFVAYRNRQRR